MANPVFISHTALPDWLAKQPAKVYVPRVEGPAVAFHLHDIAQELCLDRPASESAKRSIFPRCEELFSYKYVKDPEDIGKVSLDLHEAADPEPTLVFGCRPCDARGFLTFDPVYADQDAKDVYYLKRRATTTLVSLSCSQPYATCFCHWVGSSPHDPIGSDVLATVIDGGLLLEPVTEAGQTLLKGLTEATAEQQKQAKEKQEEGVKNLSEQKDISTAPEALLARFDDQAFWQEQTGGCLACGACTYLCPTCYCFNITDEALGLSGTRLRTWDTCMASLFTLEASGHNPRPQRQNRLKNRVGHKFSYYPSLHEKHFACCGCGRCIRSCPVSVDIRAIVLAAVQSGAGKEEVSND